MATLVQRVTDGFAAVRNKINAMMPRLLPNGGAVGQVLAKASAGDFATQWIDPPAGGGSGVKKLAADIGNGVAMNFVINHNFDTKQVLVQIYRKTAPFDQVDADIELTSSNTVTIRTEGTPIPANSFTVIVMA